MKASVYRNLHKSCWSVRNRATGRVERHMDSVTLHDCTFHVGRAGRLRVLAKGRKNVHAWVSGTYDSKSQPERFRKTKPWVRVRYDPYLYGTFVDEIGNPILSASRVVLLSGGQVFARDVSAT